MRTASFADKLNALFALSMAVIYANPAHTVFRDLTGVTDETTEDLLFGYADGLEQARHERIQAGGRSLCMTVDYAIAREESRLDAHTSLFTTLHLGLQQVDLRSDAHV